MQWSPELEKSAEKITRNCIYKHELPDNLVSMSTNDKASWKDAIMYWYTSGLETYNFTSPKATPISSFMLVTLVAPQFQKVGCAVSNCVGKNFHFCLFEWVGPFPANASEFLKDLQTNVHPFNPNSTLSPTAQGNSNTPASNIAVSNTIQYAPIVVAAIITLVVTLIV
ncbi:uncharacterized protein VTP21DRAFT_3657 [Calcarisporiella thermophila]|uniref:uncharacterized protein n=1 Tax=Calcarisporiella thermophila TaxID=911321 RepID=UPI003742FE79